jgi:hypothetical protein
MKLSAACPERGLAYAATLLRIRGEPILPYLLLKSLPRSRTPFRAQPETVRLGGGNPFDITPELRSLHSGFSVLRRLPQKFSERPIFIRPSGSGSESICDRQGRQLAFCELV